MNLDLPFWFRQRQAKAEELSTGRYKVTGPNLPEAVLSIRIGDDLKWQALLQSKADSPEISSTGYEFETPKDALAAAFELYRNHIIV